MKKKSDLGDFNLKKEYGLAFDYVKKSKNFIYTIIGIFIFFALVVFFIPAPDYLANEIIKFMQEILEKTKDLSQPDLIKFILFNNVQSSFLAILFGVVLGIFPILGTILNGYILGFVGSYASNEGGLLILLNLLPHGIFELPAIFLAFGLGLKFGTFWMKKKKIKTLLDYFWNSLRVFLLIILPLLIIAAIIEGILIFMGR